MSIKFKAEIKIIGVNPYVLVSKELASHLKADWVKPIPVIIQVNGEPKEPWHINMVPVGNGDFYLYLHGDVRKASKTKVGNIVEVEINFDEKYKNGPLQPMPNWIKEVLDQNKVAKENWEKLTPSRQKEILRYMSHLKSQEAKGRNLVRMMHVLSGNPARFMARSWKEGV